MPLSTFDLRGFRGSWGGGMGGLAVGGDDSKGEVTNRECTLRLNATKLDVFNDVLVKQELVSAANCMK
jgi:hypothetical protein